MVKKKEGAEQALKGEEAEKLVKEYLKSQYRPYSATDLVQNLHNRVNKANMVKCLEVLVASGDVVSKTYGKQVYYVYKEEQVDEEMSKRFSPEKVSELNESINVIREKANELQEEYNALVATPTNESALIQIQELRETNKALQAKAEELQKNLGESTVSKEDVERARNNTKRLQKIYRERKKILDNFLGLMRESMDNYDNIMIQIGIDIDELKEVTIGCKPDRRKQSVRD